MDSGRKKQATTAYRITEEVLQPARQHGWRVIPLLGDRQPEQGKQAAVPWKSLTRASSTGHQHHHHHWFEAESYSAYGILTGDASGLVVLDFDDPAAYSRFAARFPALLATFTVRSGGRGLPHLYYRVDFPVKSRRLPGLDLKANGGYIVGPGSVIDGKTWTVEHDRPLRSITPQELKAVTAAFAPASPRLAAQPPTQPANQQQRKQPGDYRAAFIRQVQQTGQRNNSLFTAACQMRDAAYTESQTRAALVDLFIQMPASDGRVERPASRRREAQATIRSVYTHPPRPGLSPAAAADDDEPVSRLDNAIREALLQHAAGAAYLRVLEGLYLMGIRPGDDFTEKMTRQLLKDYVGIHSIRRVFSEEIKSIFDRFCPTDKTHFFVVQQNQESSQPQAGGEGVRGRGRPAKAFVYPTQAALAAALQVELRGSDPIRCKDIRSVKRYRRALEREFIRRRPGIYHQSLLASRLNVSTRTIRRYHRQANIQAVARYEVQEVYWFNLEIVPESGTSSRYGLDMAGCFLEDARGKRWPARQEIARKLLAEGQRVTLQRQTASYYYWGDRAPPLEVYTTIPPPEAIAGPKQAKQAAPLPATVVQPAASAATVAKRKPAAQQPSLPGFQAPTRTAITYTQPLDHDRAEAAAQYAYTQIEDLSLKNARQLVDQYGVAHVQRAVKRALYLEQKGRLRNGPGFVRVAARVLFKAQQWEQRA